MPKKKRRSRPLPDDPNTNSNSGNVSISGISVGEIIGPDSLSSTSRSLKHASTTSSGTVRSPSSSSTSSSDTSSNDGSSGTSSSSSEEGTTSPEIQRNSIGEAKSWGHAKQRGPGKLPPLGDSVSVDIGDEKVGRKEKDGDDAVAIGLAPLPPLTFMSTEAVRVEKEYAYNRLSVTLVSGPFAVFMYCLVILFLLKHAIQICAPRCNCSEGEAWLAEIIIGMTLQSPLLFNYAFSTHTALAGHTKIPWVTIALTTGCLAAAESALSGGLMRVMDDLPSLLIRQTTQFLVLLASSKIGRTWRELKPALPILKFQLFVLGGLTIMFLTPLPATGNETYISILLIIFPIYCQVWEKVFTKFCQDKNAPKLRVRLWHITMAKQTIAAFEAFRLVTLLDLRHDVPRFITAFVLGLFVDVFARNDLFLVSFYYLRNLWRNKKELPKLERTPGPFKWSFLRSQYDGTYIAPAVLVAINITRFYPFASVPRLLNCDGTPSDTYLPSPAILVLLIGGEIISDCLTRLVGTLAQKHGWWWSPYCENGPPPIHIKNKGISLLTVVGAGMQALQTIGAGAVWVDALYTGGTES